MSAGRWRERQLGLVVAALTLLTATPTVLLAANVKNPWVLAGATAGAAGFAVTAAIWQDRLRRSTQRRDNLQHGVIDGCLVLRGRLPRVRAIGNPTWLGVHASAAVADRAPDGMVRDPSGPESVPLYVPRDIDSELRRSMAGSAFVLLIGDSLAGKSRSAYEAMREILPNHTLIAPNSRDALQHAIGAATIERRCVLWLNDLETYLGPGGLTRTGIASVLGGGRGHRVILATIRAVEADRLASDAPGADDLQRQARKQAREVLEQAYRIRLERLFTDAERARARAYVADRRIDDALNAAADFGIAEYLAAGPDLLSDWENAWSPNIEPDVPSHPRAAALIAAAIDIRCTGYVSPTPRALVERLHERYLDEHGGTRLRPESLESAWEWATRPRRVTTALLQPADRESVEAFDYLVDVVQRRRPPDHHVPEAVVREALLSCSAVDADSIGVVAQRQGRHSLAEHGWRTGYELRTRSLGRYHADTITAHGRLAAALRDLGRRAEAETAFREVLADSTQVLGASHPHTLLARSDLAFLLIDTGQFEEAETELRDVLADCVRALGPGHAHTLLTRSNLALLLLATRRPEEAEAELTQVVAARTRLDGPEHLNTLTARHYLASTWRALGRLTDAEDEYRDVLRARTRLLGSNHPDTRATRDALGLLLEPLPTFNVVALGAVAAGKTVLLASMFHHLNSGTAVGGLRLRASLHESTYLSRTFSNLIDPSTLWLGGTMECDVTAFNFEFVERSGNSEHPIFAINYLEYAGELLHRTSYGRATVLTEPIAEADAIFGLIDGQRLLQYLQGDPAGENYLSQDIRQMISIMRSSSISHFIITKWDLFDDFGGEEIGDHERLAIARNALMTLPHFQGFVTERDHTVIRLIPVSAVGRDFVTPDGRGGMMKRSDARVIPLNIEIPFCVIVPDMFDTAERALDSAIRAQITGTAWSTIRRVAGGSFTRRPPQIRT